MRAQKKDFFREIRKNFGRFLSIIFIVMLGTAFFAGLRSSSTAMKYSGDRYYDKTNMMDLRILGTLGITDEDIEDIQETEGVETAEGAYALDVICKLKDKQLVIKVLSLDEKINRPVLTEGRLPKDASECLVDAGVPVTKDVSIGQKLTFTAGDDRKPENLRRKEFTVVGRGYIPSYTDLERGSAEIGDGSTDAIVQILPEAFDMEVYTEAHVLAKGAKQMDTFSENYDTCIGKLTEKLEDLGERASERRYKALVDEAVDEAVAEAVDQAVKDAGKAAEEELASQMPGMEIPEEMLKEVREKAEKTAREEATKKATEEARRKAEEAIDEPSWYVLDRDKIESFVSYEQNADRMDSLGEVFPVIFFLVAALVSLTAMTRMVDEQRMQIGTMKALGYGGGTIVGRYFWYAVLATMSGGIVGVAVGERFLPYLISTSYGIMYTGMDEHLTPVNWDQAILAIAAASASTGIATLAACINQMRSRPAELMRPEAPKGGRRVFMEKLPFLWKHMNFTWKSTIRNLIRYKKRFIMTVIGVGGCMGLLLVGYGLKDSITEIAKQQYIQLFTYQAEVTLDINADEKDRQKVLETAENREGVTDTALIARKSVTLLHDGNERDADVFIPEKTDDIDNFLVLRDRISGERWEFPESGAYLSEKTAKMLGVSVGDTIEVEYESSGSGEEASASGGTAEKKKFNIKITKISENYILHYLFLSAAEWEKKTGEEPEFHKLLINYDKKTAKEEDSFGEELLSLDGCSGFSTITNLEKQIDDMLGVLNDVMWVLIMSAGLLAFVVLYNLNSINILERKRELATLKVLGFYDGEVAMYVFRENMILTVFGIVFGYVFGTILHRFTIVTVEVDLMMFGRTISRESYILCAALTLGFSLAVNLFMNRSLKKIDMIESLKSVE